MQRNQYDLGNNYHSQIEIPCSEVLHIVIQKAANDRFWPKADVDTAKLSLQRLPAGSHDKRPGAEGYVVTSQEVLDELEVIVATKGE